MLIPFEYASGSVIGRDHRDGGRNNQDGYYTYLSPDCCIAVVCDGCSQGVHSEVGAILGARLIAHRIAHYLRRFLEGRPADPATAPPELPFWERLRQDLLARLLVLSGDLDRSLTTVTGDLFLFTVVGAILSPHGAWFFSLGDGWLVINGQPVSLGPFPGNAPPYLSYGNTGSTLAGESAGLLSFAVHRQLPIGELDSFLIGSDGLDYLERSEKRNLPGTQEPLGPVSQFWSDQAYFDNPDAVRRRLAIAGRDVSHVDWEGRRRSTERGLLLDDTTLVVGRRIVD